MRNLWPRVAGLTFAIAMSSVAFAEAEEEEAVELETFIAEESISDDLSILQSDPVDSVFGFNKSILETPRSVSSISVELLEKFNVKGINDLVNFVPGTFTTSFFGVAGSLDVRGTSAENYFRGVKRLNNEGNYPTPIGASDRVDVVRGPMSPISGPSKVGGALNFIPKSARAETGQYLEKAIGEMSYTTGSWDKSIVTVETGGPADFMGNPAGYYVYVELEDSGSHYNNDFTRQTLLQTSFNTDLDSGWRIETGFMFQDWKGHENGGWNRVTQDLVDNGTYITGQPAQNIDGDFGNGDGLIQETEIDAWSASFAGPKSGDYDPFSGGITCFDGISVYCSMWDWGNDASQITQALVDNLGIGLDPETVGSATLRTSQVLITQRDKYDNEVYTAYFDAGKELSNGWGFTLKLLYDSQDYHNIDSYGFTKYGDSWMTEGQVILDNSFETDNSKILVQVSPSIRYTDALYANDYSDEIFDRADLTVGFNALSTQDLPTMAAGNVETWSVYAAAEYLQAGLAAMSDISVGDSFNALLGVRYDYVDAEGLSGDGVVGDGPVTVNGPYCDVCEFSADQSDSGVTWTASLSYKLPGNISPYVTMAEQSTIISGAAAEISTGNIAGKTFLGDSELKEFGIKTSQLDGRLYASVAVYEQERIAFNANNPVSNQPTTSEGVEFEMRYVPTEKLSLVATYSNAETKVITPGGITFSYIGAADLPNVDPATIFGGIIGGHHVVGTEPLRGALPETIISVSGFYKLSDKITVSLSATDVDETEPSVLGGLVLPDYTLVNASVVYATESFTLGVFGNNLTDETYFRGNFPSLYGNNAILPELPRNWRAEVSYKF